MSTELRDFTIPYTEEELANCREQFKKLPSFDGESFSTSEFETCMNDILKVKRTPEQIQAYVEYFNQRHGGRLKVEDAIDLTRTFSNPKEYGTKYVELIDKDKNGIITVDEFEEIVEVISLHAGRRSSVTFDRFVKEADKDGSGNVNIEECAKWLGEQLSK